MTLRQKGRTVPEAERQAAKTKRRAFVAAHAEPAQPGARKAPKPGTRRETVAYLAALVGLAIDSKGRVG